MEEYLCPHCSSANPEVHFGLNCPTHKQQASVTLVGGKATSSKISRFDLIPRPALVALANRYELGLQRHGEKSWNAQAIHYNDVIHNRGFIIERLSHIIDHATKQLAIMNGQMEDDGDDNTGAILWGGSFLACVPKEELCPLKK